MVDSFRLGSQRQTWPLYAAQSCQARGEITACITYDGCGAVDCVFDGYLKDHLTDALSHIGTYWTVVVGTCRRLKQRPKRSRQQQPQPQCLF